MSFFCIQQHMEATIAQPRLLCCFVAGVAADLLLPHTYDALLLYSEVPPDRLSPYRLIMERVHREAQGPPPQPKQ
jgi:hypothetical protein